MEGEEPTSGDAAGDASGDAASDAAIFRDLSSSLADAIERELAGWVLRCVQQRAREAGVPFDGELRERAEEASDRARREVGERIRELLSADIDDQRTTPLMILRSAVTYPTAVLAASGVPEAIRDDFERRAFPLDIYSLSPASMSDVHDSLTEPAVIWGAAKAHIHRSRHS